MKISAERGTVTTLTKTDDDSRMDVGIVAQGGESWIFPKRMDAP